ncbi:hypothetical protein AX16_006182 [Volvariella volvacea WC 439]|nr:hypothetical protein AX16_006182 [Volvariella volvacea WC 439]
MASSSPRPKLPVIFVQNACLQHKFIRSRDTSNVVERPERLRAVSIGLAVAISRIEESISQNASRTIINGTKSTGEELAAALDKLQISQTPQLGSGSGTTDSIIEIVQSSASVDILNNEAVKFVHGDIGGDVYLETLKSWVESSRDKIAKGQSEIPDGLPQGDLYLCPESLNAIQGAIGTVVEAVDMVVEAIWKDNVPAPLGSTSVPPSRAFVAIRPPGHHCGEDTPSGFCFVNNVAIGAAHAYLKHGIKRVVIFDIDLHHGNGTQSIVWQINEETYRQTLEQESGAPIANTGPTIYYGSLHDILSYPCEDGKPELIQAASVSIHKAHGQYIENIHLQQYESEDQFFDVLYKNSYSRLLRKAEEFLDGTGGPGDDVLFFISCGLDACEHEYPSMSRHNRKVPVSFYYQFTRDACFLAEKYAKGRIISVLEGGYSDRALTSGIFAHVVGLSDISAASPTGPRDGEMRNKLREWWSVWNLEKLEKATKKRRGGRASIGTEVNLDQELWLERALSIFNKLDSAASASRSTGSKARKNGAAPVPPSSRTLRDRKGPSDNGVSIVSEATSESNRKARVNAAASKTSVRGGRKNGTSSSRSTTPARRTGGSPPPSGLSSSSSSLTEDDDESAFPPPSTVSASTTSTSIASETTTTPTAATAATASTGKKLPKVILRLGPAGGGGNA